MNPVVLTVITIVGLLLNLLVAGFTVIKVSFLAGEMKQKVSDHDRRIRDLEKAQQHKQFVHLEA
jgi:uncharacterized membrane protein YciS (DUF1049 family)